MKTWNILSLTTLLFISFTARADDTNAAASANISSASVATLSIPEEARKHFVIGTTLFKDAKTPEDFSNAISKFKQATALAPQWPEARYNLALAKEAAGDLTGAMADLKLYQVFKLSDTEARTVQDKIYVIEAKGEEVDKKKAEEQKAAAVAEQQKQEYQKKIGWLSGTWVGKDKASFRQQIYRTTDVTYEITINNGMVSIKGGNHTLRAFGKIKGDDYQSIEWDVSNRDKPGMEGYIFNLTADPIHNHIYWHEDNSGNMGDTDLYKQ